MLRKRHISMRSRATGARLVACGKTFVSFLLVVTLSIMSYSPSIALAAASPANTGGNGAGSVIETALETIAAEAQNASTADRGQSVSESAESQASGESYDSGADAPGVEDASQQAAESSAPAEAAPAQSSAEATKTLECAIASTEGGSYTVKVKFGADAAIPDGATLKVIECVQEPSDPNWRDDHAYDGRPYSTERFVGKDYLKNRAAVAAKGLGATDSDYVFYSKFLEVAFVYDGQEITPQAAVEVTVETNAVDVACSDGLKLARMFYDKDIANDEQAVKAGLVASDGATARSLDAKNLTYDVDAATDRSPADDKFVRLQYSANELGEVAITGIAVPKATLWNDEAEALQVLGPAAQRVEAREASAASPAEDELPLGAYVLATDPEREGGTMLWARIVAAEGADSSQPTEPGTYLGYRLQGGEVAGDAAVLGKTAAPLAFKAADGFALFWRPAAQDEPAEQEVNDTEPAVVDASADVVNEKPLRLSQDVTTFDGNSYSVSVSYGIDAGIPEDATLSVRELTGGEYDLYRLRTGEVLGTDEFTYLRAFDISILNAEGAEIEPLAPVNVVITMMGAPALEGTSVVHFGDGAPDVIEPEATSTLLGSTLDFTTESFSVYVIADTYIRTYRFWVPTSNGYEAYEFTTDTGDTTSILTIKNGEKLFVPQPASDSNRSFAGWYEGTFGSGDTATLADKPYDFDHIPPITENEGVDLFAKYDRYLYVVFHDQYDEDTKSFPVAYTRRGVATGSAESSASTVSIEDVKVTYNGAGLGEGAMAFSGWSRTPISVPNSSVDDDGLPVDKIMSDTITISETTHLYPIFTPIHWLSFYSGPTGSGATYIPAATYPANEGPSKLEVPTRDGYVFKGWYTGTLSAATQTVTPIAQVTDNQGNLVSVNTDEVQTFGGQLLLKRDATLYAEWEKDTAASYTVVVWVQKASDALDLPNADKTYDYAESHTYPVTVTDSYSASVPQELKELTFTGLAYNRCDEAVSLSGGESKTLNVYYDRTVAVDPATLVDPYKITFTDSAADNPSPDLMTQSVLGIERNLHYGTSLNPGTGELVEVPATPASGRPGYDFSGWYADEACAIKVFFADDEAYRAYKYSKVLYATMPDRALTIYAGWEQQWYLVQIDPNYGTFNGTGSTWFWTEYGGDLIQEYTQVTRDYVESSSGTYYYVNHDRAYYGYTDEYVNGEAQDRNTKYTQDPGEATEFTTFEHAPNAYRYANWYKVNDDGTETLYDFSQPVTGNVKLKLHWKKLGTYYIEYNTTMEVGNGRLTGTLDTSDSNEAVYVELDGDSYADNATVVVNRSATPPADSGYTFVGWKVRGDESGTVYGVGQAFTLLSQYAMTVNGKDTVYLDAVYSRIGTAKIIYDANGGTINTAAGSNAQMFGAPTADTAPTPSYTVAADKKTATVGNLVNNSEFRLGDGTGFRMSNNDAVFAGWSNKPVYDPADKDAVLYTAGGTYGVDVEEPVTLYAVWKTTVAYRLNNSTASWTPAHSGVYTKDVYLNNAATLPDLVPTPGSDGKLFAYWATRAGSNYTEYDFSQPVTGPLELYACWADAITVPVRAADGSSSQFAEQSTWVKSAAGDISVSRANDEGHKIDLTASSTYSTYAEAPGYTFAFALIGSDIKSVTLADKAAALYYNTAEKKVYVDYDYVDKDGAPRDDAPLEPTDAVYFVYYKVPTPTDSVSVPVHVALVDTEGGIVVRDDLRSETFQSFIVGKDESKSFLSTMSATNVFTGSTSTYAFGAVICGTSETVNGKQYVTVESMDVDSVSYKQAPLAYGGSGYEPLLKSAADVTVGNLTNYEVYYLYYPKPQIQYVKEAADGTLTPIRGSTDGVAESDEITYENASVTMNGRRVVQGDSFEIPMDGFIVSQDVNSTTFNMPPILDDGILARYLSYEKIGAGDAGATSTSAVDADEGLNMRLQVRDNALEYSFDGKAWKVLTGAPTIYAIYGERGYDLQIMKTVDTTVSGSDPVFSQAAFGVTVSSMEITKTSYEIEGTGVSTVAATPATDDAPGTINISIKDGGTVKIRGLGKGDYTIEEFDNESYVLSAYAGDLVGNLEHINVDGNRTVQLTLDAEKRLEFVNSPTPVCKVVDGQVEHIFYTLTSAVRYIDENVVSHNAAIEMLTDYTVPAADAVTIPGGHTITLKTARGGTYHYPGAGKATIARGTSLTGAALFTTSGSLTIEDVILDGASIPASAPLVQSAGSLSIGGDAQLTNAVSTGNGGAVCATEGNVIISGCDLTNNRASSGGAVYYSGEGTFTVNGDDTVLSGNVASYGDGGAIYVTRGTVILSGQAVLEGNTASLGRGGAVFGDNATVRITESALLSGNSAVSGGAVYIGTGFVEIEGGTLTGNIATSGNGGAVCAGLGVVHMSAGTMTSNVAAAGNGGAIYVSSGESSISGGVIGGASAGNRAANGSAVYVATNTATFSGGTIQGNIATEGGAVGVGADVVKLYFSGDVNITDNYLDAVVSNVYLDKNADTVITAKNLNSSARIGVYVSGDMDATLFKERGEPGVTFGAYENTAESVLKSAFSNDRLSSVSALADSATARIMWGKPITYTVYRQDAYTENTFPPISSPTRAYGPATVYPSAGKRAISELAGDLYNTFKNSVGDRAYAGTFANNDPSTTSFDDYLTHIEWSNTLQEWVFTKRDGTTVTGSQLYFYYANPTYITIENNTNHTLDLSSLTVLGKPVINIPADPETGTGGQTGYGFVFARNGAIQQALLPVDEDDLVLKQFTSIKLLFSGATGNKPYTLQGWLENMTGAEHVPLAITGQTTRELTSDELLNGFSWSGTTMNKTGETLEIVFGGQKPICKIVKKESDLTGAIGEGEVVVQTEPDDEGNIEYCFSSISNAVAFIDNHSLSQATIEMLTDYLIPSSDAVSIPAGHDISLTTAKTGEYRYDSSVKARATISRDSGNEQSFITVPLGNNSTRLTVYDLNFDGKNLVGKSDGGALHTKDCLVTIHDVNFANFIAWNGGAIYVDFTTTSGYYQDINALNVTDVNFENCESKQSSLQHGGGAIWTNTKTMTLTRTNFRSCMALDQGGAVCHMIYHQNDNVSSHTPCVYALESTANVSECTFANCISNAAGGMEIDALNVTVDKCSFVNCQGTKRNNGGLNVYIREGPGEKAGQCKSPSYLTVTNSSFDMCLAAVAGGGLRSTTLVTTVENCTFANDTAVDSGGGIAITNIYATEATISGCTITDCTSSASGGGIFCAAKTFTVDGYTVAGESGDDTTITTVKSCRSTKAGAGIAHMVDNVSKAGSSMTIQDALIDDCVATTYGGGVYSNAQGASAQNGNPQVDAVSLTGTTIQNCSAKSSTEKGGGALCADNANATMVVLDAVTIKDNVSSFCGGGVYSLTHVTLRNDASITNNRLTSDTRENAAGLYLTNSSKVLTVGSIKGAGHEDETDGSSVTGNTTANGTASNVRLWSNQNGENNAASVSVLCGLSGQIGVANAKQQGTQFGSSAIEQPAGFSDKNSVFVSDDGTIHGIIDRSDDSGKKIIWGGPPLCKITDADGNLLYFDTEQSDPAIFDLIDTGGGYNGGRKSAFGMLRSPKLYTADGTRYPTNATYYVKILAQSHTMAAYATTNASNTGQTIIVTTAESPNECVDGYPYRGSAGSRATLYRGNFAQSKENMFTAKVNLAFQNIVLDGNNKTVTASGGIVFSKEGSNDLTVTLGKNTTLQNAASNAYGGAVYLTKGALVLDGATIINCQAANGGAIAMGSGKNFTFLSGTIAQCSATNSGGAVYMNSGAFSMSTGTIRNCSASIGGGVFIPDGKSMTMTNGFIRDNTATTRGGGIAVGGANARLNFSEKPMVYGNKLNGATCNVDLSVDSNAVINVVGRGLYSGASIGVYVSGMAGDSGSVYEKHGVVKKPFGTVVSGANPNTLYCFVNDRNNLKGGHIPDGSETLVYWSEVFSLEIINQVQVSDHAKNASAAKLANDQFTYTVTLGGRGSDGRAGEEITGSEYGVTFNEGVATVRLRSNQTAKIENLPQGLTYSISEAVPAARARYYIQAPGSTQAGTIGQSSGGQSGSDPYTTQVTFTDIFPMCKVTDGDGNLLYKRFVSNEGTECNIYAAYTELDQAFAVIESGTLYKGSATTSDAYAGNAYHVEMLEPEYYMVDNVAIGADKEVTLTTASPTANPCPYQSTMTSIAILQRNFGKKANSVLSSGESMIVANGALTLNKINLDGYKNVYAATMPGGVVRVSQSGSLDAINTTIINSHTQDDGGAIYSNGPVTLTNTTLQGNVSGGAGGAVYSGNTMTMTNSAVQNSLSGGAGGAIYDSTSLTMVNSTVKSNASDGAGAGIYVASGATLSLSGTVNFGGAGVNTAGDIDTSVGNYGTETLSGKTNGGRGHAYPKPRQDIYLAGLGNSGTGVLSSLVVNSALTADTGGIWVWAQASGETEDLNHYQVLKQFAVFGDGVQASMSNAQLTNTLRAFRNARDDEATLNTANAYLYGMTQDDAPGLIFWSQPAEYRRVILQKVDANHLSYSGASFTLYTAKNTESPLVRDGAGNELSGLRSGTSGTVYVGDVPEGEYYLYESSPYKRWFKLTVTETTVTCENG